MDGSWLLSALLFTPLGAALLICALAAGKAHRPRVAWWIALGGAVTSLGLALAVASQVAPSLPDPQLVSHRVWISTLGVEYFVGVDGLNAALMVLVTGAGCVASLKSPQASPSYHALLLLLQTGALGALAALNLLLFFAFWELVAVASLFLIGVHGGPRREQAVMKMLLVWFAGSLAMLLAIIALYRATGDLPQTFALANGERADHTFNLITLAQLGGSGAFRSVGPVGTTPWTHVVFLGLFFGFAVRLPVFPLHTWLADAHQQAPTAVRVLLPGVIMPLAAYGMVRCAWAVLPEAARWASHGVAVLGVVSLGWGALVCLAQKDLARLLAYASVSQAGLVLLGLGAGTVQAASGLLYQLCGHAVVMTWLLLLSAALEERTGSRDVDGFGGLARLMPEHAWLAAIAWLALAGTPGSPTFVGEVLVLLGTWGAPATVGSGYPLLAIIAGLASLLLTAACLWTYQRMFLGPPNPAWQAAGARTLLWRERALLYGLGVIAVLLGFVPMPLLRMVGPALQRLVDMVILAPAV